MLEIPSCKKQTENMKLVGRRGKGACRWRSWLRWPGPGLGGDPLLGGAWRFPEQERSPHSHIWSIPAAGRAQTRVRAAGLPCLNRELVLSFKNPESTVCVGWGLFPKRLAGMQRVHRARGTSSFPDSGAQWGSPHSTLQRCLSLVTYPLLGAGAQQIHVCLSHQLRG